METEKWLPIKNWEKFYEISNNGRLRSKDRIVNAKYGSKRLVKGRLLPLFINSLGYVGVLMSIKGVKKKQTTLHRLLGEHFIPNPFNLPEINHKDTNKLNNNISNLEWVTKPYNIKHAKEHGLYKKNALNLIPYRDKNKKPIIQYTLDWEFIKEWESIRAAARGIGCSHGLILNCLNKVKNIGRVYNYRVRYK
jgi:hypothetical protein